MMEVVIVDDGNRLTVYELVERVKFAGFTRTYVRNHIDEYPNLSELVAIA